MGVKVGIDLGTTFSAVAVVDEQTKLPRIICNSEGEKTTPSIIQFSGGTQKYGVEAKEAFSSGESGCAAFFKRNMGLNQPFIIADGKTYTAEDLSAMLLRYIKKDAESVLGKEIDEAVITVPAYFYSKEREATIQAAKTAGLKVKKIINEPTAAVIAYGLEHWRTNANILVYDLGGGTFDVTLVRMDDNEVIRTIATTGNRFLGGSDWDKRIENIVINKILDETGFEVSESERFKDLIKGSAEECKKQLSLKETTNYKVKIPDIGWVTINLSRTEFDNATIDLLDQTGVLCETVLKDAAISWKDVSDVLLVGGSTRMPQVKEYLNKLSGKSPISHINPDEAVALGAAVQTMLSDVGYAALRLQKDTKKADNRLLKKELPVKKLNSSAITKLSLHEVTTHPMGIIAINEAGTEYINELIIPANHPIPTRSAKSFQFHTSPYSENELEIYVLQGDGKPLECVIPYKYVVTGINHEKNGSTIIRIQYSYDQNGIIHVQARQGNVEKDLPIRQEPVPDDMSMYSRPVEITNTATSEPLNVVMAIDVSGSMDGTPLEQAQNAMCDFVDKMDLSSTKIGVVAVSDSSAVVCKMTDNSSKCKSAIIGIKCGQTGYCNAGHPFDSIMDMLSSSKGKKVAIVLADGCWENPHIAVSKAKECNKNGIETFAIGFGGVNQAFLDDISSTDENALLVSQSELTQTFGKIAQSISTNPQNSKKTTNKIGLTSEWEIN
jgi:molecular chaperone DnaK